MPTWSAIPAADGQQDLTITDTAQTLTKPAYFTGGVSPTSNGRAIIQVRTAACLFTLTGTAPTAANEATGQKLGVGDVLELESMTEINNLKIVRATGTSASAVVRYEKRTD